MLQEDVGLIPRICEGIFERVAEETDETTKFVATVSYLEIYNERVRDLLTTSPAKTALKVREHPKTGPFVDGLTVHEVTDFEQIQELMDIGNTNRTTAATGMNDTSSRSHAVFTMEFKQVGAARDEAAGAGEGGDESKEREMTRKGEVTLKRPTALLTQWVITRFHSHTFASFQSPPLSSLSFHTPPGVVCGWDPL